MAYQLYENNGVLKRDQVSEYLKNLGQNERKILRELGVKFGRYHVFLHQLSRIEDTLLLLSLYTEQFIGHLASKIPTGILLQHDSFVISIPKYDFFKVDQLIKELKPVIDSEKKDDQPYNLQSRVIKDNRLFHPERLWKAWCAERRIHDRNGS